MVLQIDKQMISNIIIDKNIIRSKMQYSQGLLSEQKKLVQFKKIQCKVLIGSRESELVADNSSGIISIGSQKIQLVDAIGLVKNQRKTTKDCQVYRLYSYPRRKKMFKSLRRYVEYVQFGVKDLQSWQKSRVCLISYINNRSQQQSLKLLIYFNPNAGSNSRKHLSAILQFIECTNLQPEVFETQYRNHCLEHLSQVDPKKYCGVAIVSGDGLMHQYVNSFCGIPVTHVPAGSGNAFAKTQMEIAGQICKDQQSIYLVIKNRKKQFNIVKYQLQKIENPIYSFLALEWAIIADLDMNSQFLRCLGGFRFEIYAAWRCIVMKRYRARLTYSTTKQSFPSLANQIPQSEDCKVVTDTFLHTIFCSIPYISDKYRIAPGVKVEQKKLDVQLLNQQAGRMQLIKYLLSSDSGSHFDTEQQKPAQGFLYEHDKVNCFRLEPLDPDNMGVFGIDGQMYPAQKIQASFDHRTFQAFV